MLLLMLAQTPTPTNAPDGTTAWPLLFLMAAAALVVGGLSFLFLYRRYGNDPMSIDEPFDRSKPDQP